MLCSIVAFPYFTCHPDSLCFALINFMYDIKKINLAESCNLMERLQVMYHTGQHVSVADIVITAVNSLVEIDSRP